MVRPLPSAHDAARILAVKRTRPFSRPPPIAGRALTKTLKALDARFGQGSDGLAARWSEIVGVALARRTQPTRLTKPRTGAPSLLELRIDGPSAAIIQHQAGDILARVNLFLGAGAVDRLRIVQGPLRAMPKARPQARAPSRRLRQPLDAAQEEQLRDSLAALPEGNLKGALTRLGREILRGDP